MLFHKGAPTIEIKDVRVFGCAIDSNCESIRDIKDVVDAELQMELLTI